METNINSQPRADESHVSSVYQFYYEHKQGQPQPVNTICLIVSVYCLISYLVSLQAELITDLAISWRPAWFSPET